MASGDVSLTFWGAASAVTGSMHLFKAGTSNILLDCGLYQGKREDAHQRNSQFPFIPKSIDAVIVSHAHIDHCGNLPTLVRQGFDGPIYVTPPTRDLLKVMLRDSAKIQEEDAAHLNIARQYAEPWVQPLYTYHDVDRVFSMLVSVPYHKETTVGEGLHFHFVEAGHVLGSAIVHLVAESPAGPKRLSFSGDLGRRDQPILKSTQEIPPADLLVCESTYGNRTHPHFSDTVAKLYATVVRTIERGGKVLIPAFSLGRSQLIVHLLQEGLRAGTIPRVPIFVDSPLASDVADCYRGHIDSLNPAVAQSVREGHGLLGGDGVEYLRSMQESVDVSTRSGAAIIIAASGMCDAGRIVTHLRQHIDDPRCTVILVSYQAYGTTGRRLLENKPTVRIQGKDLNKWLEVVHLDGFSGHADKDDFISYLQPLVGKVKMVRLIHGEREQALALAGMLEEMGFENVSVPAPGESVVL